MSTSDVEQQKKMAVSPNLDDVDESTEGVFYIQNVWIVDDATGVPVGIKHNVTFT